MQNIRRIKNRDGTVSWQIDYTIKELMDRKTGRIIRPAKRVRKSFPTKKAAKLALSNFNVSMAKGTYDDPEKFEHIRLRDLTDRYREVYGNQKVFKTSKRFHLATIERYFQRDRLLKTIDFSDLQNFQQHLLNSDRWQHPRSEKEPRKIKASTVNRVLSCLRHSFKCAVSWKLLAKNPFDDGASLQLRENNQIDRFLSKSEINALLAASPDYLRDIISVAIMSGMRKSELLSLQWQQIQWEQGIIELPETKSGEKQYVPLNADLEKLLKRIRAKKQNRGIIHTHVFFMAKLERRMGVN